MLRSMKLSRSSGSPKSEMLSCLTVDSMGELATPFFHPSLQASVIFAKGGGVESNSASGRSLMKDIPQGCTVIGVFSDG
jgi:hypothetical protein